MKTKFFRHGMYIFTDREPSERQHRIERLDNAFPKTKTKEISVITFWLIWFIYFICSVFLWFPTAVFGSLYIVFGVIYRLFDNVLNAIRNNYQ